MSFNTKGEDFIKFFGRAIIPERSFKRAIYKPHRSSKSSVFLSCLVTRMRTLVWCLGIWVAMSRDHELVVSSFRDSANLPMDLHVAPTCSDMLNLYSRHSLTFHRSSNTFKYRSSNRAPHKYPGLQLFKCDFDVDYLGLFESYTDVSYKLTNLSDITIGREADLVCEISFSQDHCNYFEDTRSLCYTNLCECPHSNPEQSRVMYCPVSEGSQFACISYRNLCDGVADCPNSDDECLCEGSVHLECIIRSKPQRVCVSQERLCGSLVILKKLSCKEFGTDLDIKCDKTAKSLMFSSPTPQHEDVTVNLNPIEKCVDKARLTFTISKFVDTFNRNNTSIPGIQIHCQTNCSLDPEMQHWTQFCSSVYPASYGFMDLFEFYCNESVHPLLDDPSVHTHIHISRLCDGSVDCENRRDELNCSGRYYCSLNGSLGWIPKDRVCDKRKDCSNGADECEGCAMGGLASSKFLIKSGVIAVVTLLAGVCIVGMNLYVGVMTWRIDTTNNNNARTVNVGYIDKVLRLQVGFYDLLTGVYLLLIVGASLVLWLKGPYCDQDTAWRGSIYCSVFGSIFSLSSHGSLLTIAVMSIIRFLVCSHYDGPLVSTKAVYMASIVIKVFNLLHALAPVLPVPAVKNLFRSEIYLTNTDNPFFWSFSGKQMEQHVRKMHQYYFQNSSSSNLPLIISDLANLTSVPDEFDFIDIGYYGSNPLCISNIFKTQDNFQPYKIGYCVTIISLLIAVSLAYIGIVVLTRKSRQAANAAGDHHVGLEVKVSLMIVSQILAWMSFIGAVIYYSWITDDLAPDKVFEVFALVVLPINSLLNPIFYSNVYHCVVLKMKVLWARFVHSVTRKGGLASTEGCAEEQNNATSATT